MKIWVGGGEKMRSLYANGSGALVSAVGCCVGGGGGQFNT